MIKMVILAMLFSILGMVLGIFVAGKIVLEKTVHYRELAEKHLGIMEVFKEWLIMLENGKEIDTYFKNNDYKKVAIYGMGYLGERLLNELKVTDIEVKYLIDQKMESFYVDIPILSLSDEIEQVDVIIVTPIYYFYSIKNKLKEKTDSKIIPITDIFK